MDINEACIKRRIKKTNIETPVIIPSFSSVVSSNPKEVGRIHNSLKDYINDASLVSAYDLYYDYIPHDKIFCSDVVFLDSGNYETSALEWNILKNEWTPILHLELIKKIVPLTQLVIVNFDQKESTSEQIESANKFFEEIPYNDFTKCFLYKPIEEKSEIISIHDFEENIDDFVDFDILGFTDKEIGGSFLNRCENIVKIRNTLTQSGVSTPIHIFGCLDPLTIICYYLCGADIFDGLSWLKYTFYNNLALYSHNYDLLHNKWTNPYDRNLMTNSLENLNTLRQLSSNLKHFSRTRDFEYLNLDADVLHQIKSLTGSAGIDYR